MICSGKREDVHQFVQFLPPLVTGSLRVDPDSLLLNVGNRRVASSKIETYIRFTKSGFFPVCHVEEKRLAINATLIAIQSSLPVDELWIRRAVRRNLQLKNEVAVQGRALRTDNSVINVVETRDGFMVEG